MSKFSDILIERIEYIKKQRNTFRFDENDDLILISNNPDDLKRISESLEKLRNKVREQIAKEIEAFKITSENAVGMKKIATDIARGKND